MNRKLHIETKCKKEEEEEVENLGEEEPLSPSAEYLNSKALSMCILGILEFEIPMDVVRMLPLVEHVFIPISSRFSSIMVTNKEGERRWKIVKVKMHDHVKIPSYPEGLTMSEYDIHFDKYLTKIGIEALPEDKPLWEIHVFKYPTSKAAGSVIFKLHHSLGDGYSVMGALLSCLQRADHSSLPLTFPSTRPNDSRTQTIVINVINRVATSMCSIYNGVCEFGWSIAKIGWIVDDETPIRSGSQGVGFHPALKISSLDLSLHMLKQIKTKLGVTINAVLTGIIFFAARSYMQMQDSGQCFRNSRSTIAVVLNTRNINGYMSIEDMLKADSKMWGNQFAFLHIAIPEFTNHNYSNPLHFVFESHKFIMAKKNSPALYFTALFLDIVRKCRGSEVAAEYVQGALKNSSLGLTSMIGPIEKMALLDHPVKGLYFMVTGAHLSITITAMSYMQSLRIGIGAELDFIDSVKFNSCIEQAFEVIYDAAMSYTS